MKGSECETRVYELYSESSWQPLRVFRMSRGVQLFFGKLTGIQ